MAIATVVFLVEHFEIRCFHATGHQDGRQNVSRMSEKLFHNTLTVEIAKNL